jgi:5'-nucleotidase
MLILVDMDGVLADFEGGFLGEWRTQFPDEIYVPLDQRSTFDIRDQYPKHLRKSIDQVIRAPEFIRKLGPVADAIAGMKKLAEHGHDVRICTSPLSDAPTCLQEKHDWVQCHLGPEWAKTLVITKDKTIIRGDVLLDDNPEIKGAYKPTWVHIVFHAPYNATIVDKRRSG